MTSNEPGGQKAPPTDESTETPLAETLAAVGTELDRLERHSAADAVEVDYADEAGRVAIFLRYHGLGGEE
jgi:hypothetical protein